MKVLPLFPAPGELRTDSLAIGSDGTTIHASAKRHSAAYPRCGHASDRVHSRYGRTLADLPWHGTAVRLRARTRRFFRTRNACERRIFGERISGPAEGHARSTLRSEGALCLLGLALGGRAGAWLAGKLAVAGSRDTFLRHLRTAFRHPSTDGVGRVLGVDDGAWRKGKRYGTLLVELERHRVVDLLPDWHADTLARRLRDHPEVEVITRDRSTEYTCAIMEAAPTASQVTDR